MSRQFKKKKNIWRLQKDTWKLNDIRGLMSCKILLTKLYNTFYPPACHSPLPPCPKRPLLAAILRQQQVEKIIKNGYNNTILSTNVH